MLWRHWAAVPLWDTHVYYFQTMIFLLFVCNLFYGISCFLVSNSRVLNWICLWCVSQRTWTMVFAAWFDGLGNVLNLWLLCVCAKPVKLQKNTIVKIYRNHSFFGGAVQFHSKTIKMFLLCWDAKTEQSQWTKCT